MFIKKLVTGALLATSITTTSPVLAGNNGYITKFDDVAWQNAGLEGVEMSVLWGDEANGSAVYAFRIQPGVAIPAHLHSNDYWGIAVQGNWEHTDHRGNAIITAQEALTRIQANDLHSDRCAGPEVCINVLDFDGPRDFILPK